MGGHHEPKLPKIPDWRIYRVEDVPQLVQVEKKLAHLGLKDPWLRNEVWRYTTELNKYSRWWRLARPFTFGLKYGVIAGGITAAFEYAFFPLRTPPSYEGEGHH